MDNSNDDIRAVAMSRLKKKSDLKSFLVVWLFVSAVVTGIWFFATPGIVIGGLNLGFPQN